MDFHTTQWGKQVVDKFLKRSEISPRSPSPFWKQSCTVKRYSKTLRCTGSLQKNPHLSVSTASADCLATPCNMASARERMTMFDSRLCTWKLIEKSNYNLLNVHIGKSCHGDISIFVEFSITPHFRHANVLLSSCCVSASIHGMIHQLPTVYPTSRS